MTNRQRRSFQSFSEVLEPRRLLAGGTANEISLVAQADGSNLVAVGNLLFFSASDATHGRELWVADGINGGAAILLDINPGTAPSLPQNLTAIGSTLYFSANDGVHGVELWKSDGTPQGTVMVRDIDAGAGSSLPANFTLFRGSVYFTARPAFSYEMWMTDGSTDGTSRALGPLGNNSDRMGDLLVFDDRLLFINRDVVLGGGLWMTDGLSSTATQLASFFDGSPAHPFATHELTRVGDRCFFRTFRGNSAELWVSNLTPAGTHFVANIGGGNLSDQHQLAAVGDVLLFAANVGGTGLELWRSDGTPGGTTLVRDIRPGPEGSILGTEKTFAVLDNLLLFGADDGQLGQELWRSDGTPEGTFIVEDTPLPDGITPYHFVSVGGELFFSGRYGIARTDGTVAGTALLNLGLDNNTFGPQDAPAIIAEDLYFFGRFPFEPVSILRLSSHDAQPPVFNSASYRFNVPPPSIEISTSEDVSGGVNLQSVIVQNLTSGQQIPSGQTRVVSRGPVAIALEFPAFPHGAPPDGNYRLTIPANAVSDAYGNQNQVAFEADFFVLAGDADRDRLVGPHDLTIMSQHFGRAGGWNFGDYDLSGFIDFSDFAIIAPRYGTMLQPPGQSSARIQMTAEVADLDAGHLAALLRDDTIPWLTSIE